MLNISNRISINTIGGGGDGLTKIFDNYGFLNMWSSENLTISGTDTTAIDYAGEHDLVNPAAGNQPIYSASDANFNSKPSLTFDGTDDYLSKSFVGYRNGDNTGVMVNVYRRLSGTYETAFCISEVSSDNNYVGLSSLATNNFEWIIRRTTFNNNYLGTTINTNNTDARAVAIFSDGVNNGTIINGVDETIAVTGTDGLWVNDILDSDTLEIGALLINPSFSVYSNIGWCFSGYLPYVSKANIIALQNELKTYYGI